MKTYHTTMRMIMALAIVMFPLLKAHADWDWEWTDTWGEAVAWCEECGSQYTIYAESSAEAEAAAEELFCSDCGCCTADVNSDCWHEHHCRFCESCIADGEYHDGIYNQTDMRICYDCADELIEVGEIDACHYCHELFGEGAIECDCGYSTFIPHCTDCSEVQCDKCNTCLVIDGEETDAAGGDACLEHEICSSCMENAAAEDQVHCRQCFMCDEDVCDECGLCESCADYEEHCPECGECFGDEVIWCEFGGEHCIHCCEENDWKCPQCGKCTEGAGLDLCSDCELCEECCHSNSESEGCEHGYCIASADYEDHLCPECGACPQDEECEYCGLCLNCQADYHCEHELCPDGSDWDDHVCPDCGECFDEGELCEYCGLCENCREHCDHDVCPESDDDFGGHFICDQCGDCYEGEERCDICELCLNCCADNTSSVGCDHDLCIESDEFAEHWCYEDDQCLELCEHDAECQHLNVSTTWRKDVNAHWNVCEDCGIALNKAIHSEGTPVTLTAPNPSTHTNGTAQVNCAVCNYRMSIISIPYVEVAADGKPYILSQPTDYTGKTNTSAYLDVPQRYATFKVKAGGANLSYQWYKKTVSGYIAVTDDTPDEDGFYQHAGAQTATLKAVVLTDACDDYKQQYYKYYCVISNERGSVTSDVVTIKAQHVFGRYRSKDSETHENYCFGECSAMKEVSKHRFTEWTLVRPATSEETGLREQTCLDCQYKNSEVIPKVEPGHVHSYDIAKYSITQHWFVCKCGISSPEPPQDHNFDETEVITEPTVKKTGENKLICSACGFSKTEKTDKLPHTEHEWYAWNDPDMFIWGANGRLVPDPNRGSRGIESHTVKCKLCDEKNIEKHVWPVWENSRDAKISGTDTIPGKLVRYCDICGYCEEKFYPLGSWPIMVLGGKAYDITIRNGRIIRSKEVAYAKPGETIFLAYDPKAAQVELSFTNVPVKFKQWISGYTPGGDNDIPWDGGRSDIILQSFTFRFNRTAGLYAFTMPDGPAVAFADTEECDHSGGTKQSKRVAATCSSPGHEPHTLCKDCDTVLEEGARIPALGHDLPDTPIAGTEIVEYCMTGGRINTWSTYGYTGEFLCNRCGERVKGKRTPQKHGSYWVDSSGSHLQEGHGYMTMRNIVWETCTKDGYSGDYYCNFCNKLAEKGHREPRHGHDWGDWETIREATTTVKGMEQRHCLYDDEHVETRLTDYSGPDYRLKPNKTRLHFEWTYGQQPPTQTINLKSIGRNSIAAITNVIDEDDWTKVSIDGMTLSVTPDLSNQLSKERSRDNGTIIALDFTALDQEGKTIHITFPDPEIIVTSNIKKTEEKYTLTVLDGVATTFTYDGATRVLDTNTSRSLQVRGGQNIKVEPDDEWRADFLYWQIVSDASGLIDETSPSFDDKETWELKHSWWNDSTTWGDGYIHMSPNDVTVRAIYKKNLPSLKFTENILTASVGATVSAPQLLKTPGNLAVTYKSSDESIATVDAATGKVTMLKEGTATIIATSEANIHYAEGRATFLVTTSQEAPIAYDLFIAGTQVFNINKHDILGDGKVSFDTSTGGTLTLKNVDINSTTTGILAQKNLHIKLVGENHIASERLGMNLKGTTIEGPGSLIVKGTTGVRTSGLTISGGALVSLEGTKAYGFLGGSLSVSGRETIVMLKGKSGYGAYVGSEPTLSDGLTYIQPEGAYYDEEKGNIVRANGTVVANEWVMIANQDYVDGINNINTDVNLNDAMYNLAGQKVGKDYKGIVIQGGRKLLKK